MSSSFSLIMIGLLLLIIVILLALVISILSKGNKTKTNVKKERIKASSSKSSVSSSLPSTKSIYFPANIEKLSSKELYFITKKIYESYRYFDYKNMEDHDLDKKEWHSWQISILLKVYKMGDDYYIGNKDEVFHSSLLNASEKKINLMMDRIIKRYEKTVNIDAGKDKLSKEYEWSNMDASVIFYFLSTYKDYNR